MTPGGIGNASEHCRFFFTSTLFEASMKTSKQHDGLCQIRRPIFTDNEENHHLLELVANAAYAIDQASDVAR